VDYHHFSFLRVGKKLNLFPFIVKCEKTCIAIFHLHVFILTSGLILGSIIF